jgi:hypothetical protein
VVDLVKKYGPKRWTLIAKHLKGRIGKQCRERWHNHLNPEIKKTAWTEEEVNSFLLYSSVSYSDPDWIRIQSGQWIHTRIRIIFFPAVIFFQFLVIKALDPDWIRIRIGLHPDPLDPDPDP